MFINYFEKNKTGVLVARMTSDMQSLNEFAREGASSIITALLTIFGATIAVFLVDVRLAFLSFLILPLLGIATKIFRNYADKAYWSVREGLDRFYHHCKKAFLELESYRPTQMRLLS